jgi:hypothetical protein
MKPRHYSQSVGKMGEGSLIYGRRAATNWRPVILRSAEESCQRNPERGAIEQGRGKQDPSADLRVTTVFGTAQKNSPVTAWATGLLVFLLVRPRRTAQGKPAEAYRSRWWRPEGHPPVVNRYHHPTGVYDNRSTDHLLP